MVSYSQMDTEDESPYYFFVKKLKELWNLIEKTDLSKFIVKLKDYDLYPLRNVLEGQSQGTNRFNMEQMADAGEAYGELLDIILKDLKEFNQESFFTDVVRIPLEKQYTCEGGEKQTFPYDENCMMLILLADSLMVDYGFRVEDDHAVLIDQQGRLPKIVNKFLTKDLDFHQKEHLRSCRYRPNDWKYKSLKIKDPSVSRSSRESRINSPDVISINLTWQQSSPRDVLTTLNMIPSMFRLSDMFELPASLEDKAYYFKGMIGYWGLHYFCFIRHITQDKEVWVEYNDKELFKMPSWEAVVDDCVRNSSTPTLLIFENIDTVEYQHNIEPLIISEDKLMELKDKGFKNTRAAKYGRVDLGKGKGRRDIEIEGDDPFRTHSDHPVAAYGYSDGLAGSKYSGGSKYGVSSHKTKVIEDNWSCNYGGSINPEQSFVGSSCKNTNHELKDYYEQENYGKTNTPSSLYKPSYVPSTKANMPKYSSYNYSGSKGYMSTYQSSQKKTWCGMCKTQYSGSNPYCPHI